MKVNRVWANGCNGASFVDHGVSLLGEQKSHAQALGQECCHPGVLWDGGDASANILCQLYGHVNCHYRIIHKIQTQRQRLIGCQTMGCFSHDMEPDRHLYTDVQFRKKTRKHAIAKALHLEGRTTSRQTFWVL